jgi:predicted HTH domain antitoxin
MEVLRMQISLEIPKEVLHALKLPPPEVEAELRKELALALYQRGVLPLGKARVLAGMKRREFEELLGRRQIPRHYGLEEVEEDIRYARRGR